MATSAPKLRKDTKRIAEIEVAIDPVEVAEEAGLRYVSDDQPGYTRKTKGDDFEYFDTDGKAILDETRLLRIPRIAIPPAYKDVWICPSPKGHIQATARDARGRKQYRYHERWREARDENKYDRMLVFGKALPKIRRQVNKDMGLRDLPRNKILATVVNLLGRTFIRIGNEEYARQNNSFGLTTMRNRHVEVKGAKLTFNFKGKSGVKHEIDVSDRRLANIIRKLQDLPGQDIFQYEDEAGEVRNVTSQDVNDYLQEVTGEEFTAKDFRTWAGTVLTATALNAQGPVENKAQAKKNIKDAITAVAKILGNTPTVCRKCYVHPVVVESYLDGDMIEGLRQKTEEALAEKLEDLRAEEAAVMSFLQTKLAEMKK
ncbi:MAG TPA: DNA topoisomerase IB [Chthoniobacterales bacterium]|nr:DNA topoisomerase IB [Chthoniobacterales bacterium]